MTPDETARVLRWLRKHGANKRHEAMGRRILQRALRGGEPISREIRDAMADWLIADAASLLVNSRGEMYYGPEDAVHIPEKPKPSPDAQVTFRNDVELGSWNDPKPAPSSPADGDDRKPPRSAPLGF